MILNALVIFSSSYAIEFSSALSQSLNKNQSQTGQNALLSDTLAFRYNESGNKAIFISGKIATIPNAPFSLQKMSKTAQNKLFCQQYLSKIKHALKINKPSEEFEILDLPNNNTTSSHYKIKQKYHGLIVLGAEATIHIHDTTVDFVGRTIATPTIDIVPSLSPAQAINLVTIDLANSGIPLENLTDNEKNILDYSGPSADLVVSPVSSAQDSAQLAYQVLIRPDFVDWWEYVVDAKTSGIIFKVNRTRDAGDVTASVKDLRDSVRAIHAYLSDKYYLIDASRPMFNASKSQIPNTLTGAIVTYDYQNKNPATSSFNIISNTQNTWNATAVSAQYNASVAYEYYRGTHGRNSINGNGGSILSFINVADQTGKPLDNAYWNGKGMFYGNGNKIFYPLAAALDVSGHELTHGVVQATAALNYSGQSGALNESFADIFGCMIERNNWTMGETILRPGLYPSNALRDLSNPHNGSTKGKAGWQPQSMSEYQVLPNTTAGDNGGVHINDGIPNYAYYLFATSIGKDKAEKVYYRTLTTYLGASAQFVDLRISSILACEDLFGKGSAEATALSAAFDKVEIFDNTPSITPQADLPINPGKEFVLLTSAPPASDGTTLYIADSAFGSLKSVSKRQVKFRPSVSDDGKKALFVSSDKKLISLSLDANPVTETVIDSSPIWSLCALSRDGNRFAAVKDVKDTSIYIGSMSGGPMHRFNLNGPADSNAHIITGAVYSSALEWNFTGEEVIYDVYNSLSGSNGTNITDWDIGFLSSWDQQGNTFGDGEVSKLFNNLPDGVSVGNPTFSKNSPNIIAYESIDNTTHAVTVNSMNMETRKSVVVASTAFPGYPCFSKRDDKIAFSTKSGSDTVVSTIALNPDKQTPSGNPVVKINKMKWAVYFATGTRVIPSQTNPALPASRGATVSDLRIISCKHGLRAVIFPGNQATVWITIARADGKIVKNEIVNTNARILPYEWNGKSLAGITVGNGIYIIRMQTMQGTIAKKAFINW